MADQMKLSSMSNKQKIMAVVVIIVLLVVAWQVVAMFSQGGSPASEQPTFEANTAAKPGITPTAAGAGAPGGAASVNTAQGQAIPQNAGMPQQPVIKQEELKIAPTDVLAGQNKAQENYINALNQLQMLRIEREIAETNQAISSAKLATVKAEKDVSDLLARPSAPAPLPQSAYTNKLLDSTALGGPGLNPSGGPTSLPPAAVQETIDVPYVVVSVSMQLNKWNAILGYKGDLYTVGKGDILSVDGSKVVSINKSGVVLQKNGKRRKISLTGQI